MKKLLIGLSAIFIISFATASIKDATGSRNKADTTRPIYVYKMTTPAASVEASVDSINRIVLPILGKTLSVDAAEDYKRFLLTQLYRIIGKPVLDSIVTKK